MKVRVSAGLASFDGTPLRASDAPDSPTATLKSTFELALVNFGEASDDGETKYKRYKLLQRIHNADDEVELTVEEIAQLKQIVGKMFGAVVVGAVYDALEGV